MIYLSPYRSIAFDKLSKNSISELISWRDALGERQDVLGKCSYARVYWHRRRATYSYEYGVDPYVAFGPNDFINLDYARYMMDLSLKKEGCLFLSEERFYKLGALK